MPGTLRHITLPWPCTSTIITLGAAPKRTLPAGLSILLPFWLLSLAAPGMGPQNTPRRASRLSLSRSGGWTAGQGGVLGMFARKDTVTAQEVAAALGLSGRMARNILTAWVKDGWLVVANASNRARAYRLSAVYRLKFQHKGIGAGFSTKQAE